MSIVMIDFFTNGFIPGKMHYNYFLELCSLVFLVAVTIAYYSRKKFPTSVFALFGVCLVVTTATVLLDIGTCWFLDNSNIVPVWLNEAALELLYFSHMFCSYLIFAYVFYSIGKSLRISPLYYLTMLPTLAVEVLIFTNCLHHWIFTMPDAGNGYLNFAHGPAFFLLYVAAGLNIFATLLYAWVFRNNLKKKFLALLFIVVILFGIAVIIHYFQPKHLVYGIVYTMTMIFTIITVNDPDEKVDRISNAFTNEAFIDYINGQRIESQFKHFIIFDIESFGMFSEKFGNLYSSELLASVRRFVESVNKKTLVFKSQSASFILLNKTREEQIYMVEAIKNRFKYPFTIIDKSINISINLFYFVNRNTFRNSDSYKNFITRTITSLNFRDQNYVELDEAFMTRINRDRRIKEILERCLKEKNGLYMVYQPIYDVGKKCFNHFEALIRLDNEELGYVGPAEFIPIAEAFGLANEIDYFVLNETCSFLERNRQVEILEINISCAEFFNNPSERFLKIIKEHSVDPRRICLEITETIAVKYPEKTKQFMADLGQYGVQFAMDDFGSGYSNVARFITLPFSIAKLDKSLLEDTQNIKVFFDSAVNLFKTLNIPIVVEGVENEAQLKTTKAKKIDYIQGYYFSKPLREEDLLKFLATTETDF